MMPANRILMAGWAGWAGWAGNAGPASRPSRPSSPSRRSSFRRLDQLVDAFRIVEGLADRQARAHPAVQLARLEKVLVPPLRGDFTAIQHEDAIGVADGGEAVR